MNNRQIVLYEKNGNFHRLKVKEYDDDDYIARVRTQIDLLVNIEGRRMKYIHVFN